MHRLPLTLVLLLFIGVVVVSTQSQGSFQEEVNQGTHAYKAARYDKAAQHFQNAIGLNPENVEAHLYLATTYAQQYIPGVNTPENNRFALAAVAEYQAVLRIDPKSIDSIKGVAYLDMQSKKFEEAKAFFHKAVELNPRDPEAYYSIAVIDWTQAYSTRMPVFEKLHLSQDQPLINKPECWDVRSFNEEFVRDGMEMLTEAMELRPGYDDAMAYMNLMYRERANIQCSDFSSYDSDLKAADHWVDLTIATKKAKSAQADQSPQQVH